MPRPSASEIYDFASNHLWRSIVVGTAPERINVRAEFVDFLRGRGVPEFIAEEYAERNIGLVLQRVVTQCSHWELLGLPLPCHVTDQLGSMITWRHPRFETVAGLPGLSENFCDVWTWVKTCVEREFLFCCAAYLFQLGCSRIHITDSTGDGGIDVIGIHDRGPLRGLCFLVQAKTAHTEISKESLFSDYTKFLLLRRNSKWEEYQKAAGIDKSRDGVGLVYIFASNLEFNQPLIDAARELQIMLRSGRQIAHGLAGRTNQGRWSAVRVEIGTPTASLSRNLANDFARLL